jgi:5'-nucleotidase
VAVSVSSESHTDFERAAGYGFDVLKKLLPLRSGDVVNINIPRLSAGEPRGVQVVPQATSGFHEYYIPQKNGDRETVFQLAGGAHRDEETPADTTALAEGFITVTPLLPDMTNHTKIAALRERFNGHR